MDVLAEGYNWICHAFCLMIDQSHDAGARVPTRTAIFTLLADGANPRLQQETKLELVCNDAP
jgi:hypothetical protein